MDRAVEISTDNMMGVPAIPIAIEEGEGLRSDAVEQRTAPRFTSLIRAAKLVSGEGEHVCVVRDVSTGGVRLRCFHPLPRDEAMVLELQNGDCFDIQRVREEGFEASFRFATEAPIERLVQEHLLYPRRPLRLNIAIPLSLRTLTGVVSGVTQNLSQQGCRIEIDTTLALSQSVIVESPHLPGIRAKVRWRRGKACGLVFDDTFTLKDFAIHAARLQSELLGPG